MRKQILYLAACLALTGCAATTTVRVTPLGLETGAVSDQVSYMLPQTVLRLDVHYRITQHIPGPYWEYAQRYLGITDVIQLRSTTWQIGEVSVSSFSEPDPGQVYAINVLEGKYDPLFLKPYLTRGLVMDGTELHQQEIGQTIPPAVPDPSTGLFRDRSIYGNYAERTETMYKTLVTDTSYVRVPVERTIVEQKTAARKAEEAANFLLELRTRRFEVLTGEYEVFPDGEAMQAAIEKLDELEDSYLSLFTGKNLTSAGRLSFFLVPRAGEETYLLGMFSPRMGFLPEELMEGDPLQVTIRSLGKTAEIAAYDPDFVEGSEESRIRYRIPDVAELKVMVGETLLTTQRISIFQLGAVVTGPTLAK